MPRGFARYDAFQVHYRATKLWAWSILQAHFPELAGRALKTFVEVPERLDHKTLTVEV
jgi:hypothetical protein